MESRLMTEREKADIIIRAHELREAGLEEEARNLRKTVPIAPFIAKIIKDKLGADTLIQCNMNLAEAEAEYGQDWLTR